MKVSDRYYLLHVAQATLRAIASERIGQRLALMTVHKLPVKPSGTGGWMVRLGSVVGSGVEMQLWYDQFIGYPHRRLWAGLHSADIRNVQRYANHRHIDIGDNDIIRNPQNNEWMVRKTRQAIYFDRAILEKYRTGRDYAGYLGRYLISKSGRIKRLPVGIAANQASQFFQDILGTHFQSKTVVISPVRFRQALNRFQLRHVTEDGRQLQSFHDPTAYVARTEGYKSAIPERAKAMLETANWSKGQIGNGDILSRVIRSIELPRNNLLFWQAQYGPNSAVHQPLKAALRSRQKRAELDVLFYELYKRQKVDQHTFDGIVRHTGRRYELLSYLFFISAPQKYLPLRTTHFDRAFRLLGIDLRTRGNCNWDNYQDFVAVVREVQRRLHAEGFFDASLLDAHSFLWILSQKPAELDIKIASPQLQQFTGRFRVAGKRGDFNPNDEAVVRDMKRDLERRSASGEVAEEYAKQAEIKRLLKAKRKTLAAKVEVVSDRPGLGYDIKSYEKNGRGRFIEVKNVTKGRRFFLSEGEWLNSRKRKNFWFYLVDEQGGAHPLVNYVQARQVKQENLQPVQYLVRF